MAKKFGGVLLAKMDAVLQTEAASGAQKVGFFD